MKFLMDLHTHTVASIHAYSTLTENAVAAKQRGLQILGVSDHGYGMAQTTQRTYWLNLQALPNYLEGVRLLKGMEANIMDDEGRLAEEKDFKHVDYVIASLHGNCYYDTTQDQDAYTQAVCRAMANESVKIFGHPDDGRYPLDYAQVARVAAEQGIALEVNNSSLQPYSSRIQARENMQKLLQAAKKESCRVIVNSDAHMSTAVGDFSLAQEVLEEAGYPPELIVNFSWQSLEELLGFSL